MNFQGALAGAAIGTGLMLIAAGWRRPPPDLRITLARLDGPAPPSRGRLERVVTAPAALDSGLANPTDPKTAGSPAARLVIASARHLAAWAASVGLDLRASPVVRAIRLDRLAADLRLLDETLEILLVRKLGYLLTGLAFAPGLAVVLAALGTTLPWVLTTMAALALGGVLFVLPDVDVRVRARRARSEIRQAVCAYLELVALERAADAGAIEALERAATVSDAPAFERIRAALTRAQLDGVPPWDGLNRLAVETGVPELGDLADIMSTSGRQGAAVYDSLRARAVSLRAALSAEQATAANAASERMVIPVAAQGLIFMALIAFPAVVRIVTGQ